MPLMPHVAVACAAALLLNASPAATEQGLPSVGVRLHHLHFRTGDVAMAMAGAVKVHGGTRTLVQGLGVGVRVVDTYLLFEPGDAASPSPAAGPVASPANAFIEAARWLGDRRVEATMTEAATRMLLAIPPGDTLDHVGLSTADLDGVVAVLRTAGAVELRRTADSVFYRTNSGVIEITRETELPDAFWCPMHPHVRSPYVSKCPVCAMDLVAIAPPRVGEYLMDVTQVPSANRRGIRGLKLRIRDPDSGEDVPMFAETHERLLHLFIIGRDLKYFAHEHPVQTAGGFELDVNLAPGAYMVIADFLPGGGYPQMVHRAIVTPGHVASPFVAPAPLTEDLTDKIVDGLRVKLTVSQARERPEAVLRFLFSDAVTDAPIRDLELYLGSSGHLLIVSPDLTDSIHGHPEGKTFGPDINFGVVFPAAGVYKVWIQVQRGGKVFTAPFVVGVQQ